MPKLSLIEAEAEHLVGRLPEQNRIALQQALIDLCAAHWREMRGPQPALPLAYALWSVTPPRGDLFADLYAARDPRLDQVLRGLKPAQGMALLVLAEIARGDAEGARFAHEPMMLFGSAETGGRYAQRIATALRNPVRTPPLSRHAAPLWKALAITATQTGRCDLQAMIAVIRLLADEPDTPEQTADAALTRLRHALNDLGVRFLGIDENRMHFEQHGHAHKPASIKELSDILLEIRQLRLA